MPLNQGRICVVFTWKPFRSQYRFTILRICTTAVPFLTRLGQADSQRVMTFSNEEDVVFFRHHTYEKQGAKDVMLHEVGPRFEMQLYQLRLGTLDQVRLCTRVCGRITALRYSPWYHCFDT